jgi:ubiquinone/menaquinone biosynthesis C-methylase UbiE
MRTPPVTTLWLAPGTARSIRVRLVDDASHGLLPETLDPTGSDMTLRDSLLATTAKQLGHPNGRTGQLVGRLLNRGNRALVLAAIDAMHVTPGQVVADIGFGGGVALGPLLDRVSTTGVVHGIEISDTMLRDARRRLHRDLDEGRLQLHKAAMDRLPMPDDTVDAVVSTNTLYFVDDLDGAFAEIARVLRVGGRLALGVGDPETMAKMPFTKHGFRLRPIDALVDSLTNSGLTLIENQRVGNKPGAPHVLVATESETTSGQLSPPTVRSHVDASRI